MKSLRLLGAAIIAVLALGVVGVATAAAAPELGAASLPAKFAGAGVGKAEKISATGTITCKTHASAGEFTTQTDGRITITFTGCTTEAEGSVVPCKSNGAASGDIVVPNAPILLVSLEAGSTLLLGVLIQVTPTLLIKCGVLSVELKGSVLGAFPTVVNGTSIPAGTAKELSFKEVSGKQQYTTCQGGANCGGTNILECNFGTGFNVAILVATQNVTFAVSVKPTF